jgi:hypothetical protein
MTGVVVQGAKAFAHPIVVALAGWVVAVSAGLGANSNLAADGR